MTDYNPNLERGCLTAALAVMALWVGVVVVLLVVFVWAVMT
jgi:hypothetical protein